VFDSDVQDAVFFAPQAQNMIFFYFKLLKPVIL